MLTKDEIDAGAKAIYALWANKPGYVPWVPNGNSTMQDEARRLARVAIAAHTRKVLEDVEPVAWLDTVIDWTATGQPITRRICIQAQCGDWALSYIESALRETATTVAALKLQRDALQARVDALEGVIDSVLLDIDDDGVAEARDIAILAMRNIRNNRPQYEGLVDAAMKGQP